MKRLLITTIVFATSCGSCGSPEKQNNGNRNNVEVFDLGHLDRIETDEIDILFVVDNSGSMCQEQTTLSDNLDPFLTPLIEADLDFHIGVTTTHMDDNGLEPVAVPGNLQSTPQPIPGFDQACASRDEVLVALSRAVNCMTDPDPSFGSPTNADLDCAFNGTPAGCEIDGRCSGNCTAEHLFPTPDTYRPLPTVFRSADYEDAQGEIALDRLIEDMGCAMLVGTRGNGFEKGLGAAVLATSLEKTGGPVDNALADGHNIDAPNHGLLRARSRFALVFLSDENDCTHDGTLDEESSCGDAVCEYASVDGSEALLNTDEIRNTLLANLASSKSFPIEEDAIAIAALVGPALPFNGEPQTECLGETGVEPSCTTASGTTFSGDRYLDFVSSFEEAKTYPQPGDTSQGALCAESFNVALAQIGELIAQP